MASAPMAIVIRGRFVAKQDLGQRRCGGELADAFRAVEDPRVVHASAGQRRTNPPNRRILSEYLVHCRQSSPPPSPLKQDIAPLP